MIFNAKEISEGGENPVNTRKETKSVLSIIVLSLIGCAVMAVVDGAIIPHYAVKSFLKIVLFLLIPFGYSLLDRDVSFRRLFILRKKGAMFVLMLGLLTYGVILALYFTVGRFFDFSNITATLESSIGVTKDNFAAVSLYISFVNSLLEEFFFRGFVFLCLYRLNRKKTAYVYSALLFAVYHIAIMGSWFAPLLLGLLISGLFAAGLIFNWLNKKTGNIYPSWMVHMFANFAINTVGFILFGIV